MRSSDSPLVQMIGHSHAPRHQVVMMVNDSMSACGVILDNFHEYSNRMITYCFEMSHERWAEFRERLEPASIVLSDTLGPEHSLKPDDDGFVKATLQISFPGEDGRQVHPNPDLG